MSDQPLLQLSNVSYQDYGPINLTLQSQQTIAISGPSGTGKSLLLKVIADLIPHQGETYFRGQLSTTYSPMEWRRQVGLLLANAQWWGTTIAQHFPVVDEDLLQLMGLNLELLQKTPQVLSSGQLQRLSLLRLLANEPSVLLLDEPTAHLDVANTQQIEAVIQAYQQQHGCGVIWVSHNIEQVKRLAEEIYTFEGKQLQCRESLV